MRVLIVEPSEEDRKAHADVVAALEGGESRGAGDAVEAIATCDEYDPDLAIVEGELADMDGLALIRQLRKKKADLPVIVVSYESERARVIDAIKAGADDYLVKPFTPDLLNQRIGEALDRRRAA